MGAREGKTQNNRPQEEKVLPINLPTYLKTAQVRFDTNIL